jgi:DNA polymerase-1
VKADGQPAKYPQATKDGKLAIAKAFSDLGVDLPSTDSGSPALSKKVMSTIIDEFGPDSGVGQLADLVKGLNGERSIYGTILDHLAGERVHPRIDPRQSSGRLSITNPGLTIMGKRGGKHVEREVFLPEPGELIIAADMSQIDARAIAAHCQDPEYMAMFDDGKDFHTEVALLIFGDASRRDDAKAITHGWNYGESIKRIAADNQIDIEVVKEFDRGMRERFAQLVTWRDEIRAMAASGAMLDNGFGRMMRPVPERSWTQGPALIGQGCARDLMIEAVLRLPLEIVPMMRAFVHDEIVLSVPEHLVGEVSDAVVEAMTFTWRDVPITGTADAPAPTWGAVYAK